MLDEKVALGAQNMLNMSGTTRRLCNCIKDIGHCVDGKTRLTQLDDQVCCAKLVACVKPLSTELVNTRGNEKSTFLVVT